MKQADTGEPIEGAAAIQPPDYIGYEREEICDDPVHLPRRTLLFGAAAALATPYVCIVDDPPGLDR
jgi:hypothetical protein